MSNSIPSVNSNFFVTESEAGKITFKEFRKKIQDWLKIQNEVNPRFQKVFNQSFKHDIYFTWQGLKNDVSESSDNYTEKLLSFEVLPQIVENGIYMGAIEDKKKRPDIENIHYLKSIVIVNNILYNVDICVFEVKNNKKENIFVYAHSLSLK